MLNLEVVHDTNECIVMKTLRPDIKEDFLYSIRTFSPSEDLHGGILSEYDILRAHYYLADYFIDDDEPVSYGVLNYDMLSSATSRQYVSYNGQEKWSSPFEKLATLLFGLTKDHAFKDGNKRTAFLSLLLGLYRINRQIDCKKSEFESLLVHIAANTLHNFPTYKQFVKKDDPEVNFIAEFIKRRTRRIDTEFHSLTFAEFNQKLKEYGVWLDNPSHNYINVYKKKDLNVVQRMFRQSQDERIMQIGFPGWKRQINLKAAKEVLKQAGLTPINGIDSKVFFEGAEPEYKLINEYHYVLKRLKDK